METTTQQVGEFGQIYTEFENKPKDAIKHLKKVENGECTKALYRKDVGYIDLVWGEHNSQTNNGYGLKHIIEKHGDEVKQLGFEIDDFIPLAVQYGLFDEKRSSDKKIILSNKMFRVVIAQKWNGKSKTFLLTTFDLRKKA